MKSLKFGLIIVAVALAASAGTAQASRIFLSTTSLSPFAGNPTINMAPSGTAALFLFWQPTTETYTDNTYGVLTVNEVVNGMGLDIDSSNPILSRTNFTFLPAPNARWGSTGSGGGAVTFMVDDANAAKVGGSNMGNDGGANPNYLADNAGKTTASDASTVWRFGEIDFQATGTGTSSIRLGVGNAGISFQNSPSARNINFGFGDAAISSNSFGSTTTVADATVNVTAVPEPATLALLGLGAVGLAAVARRRRRT